MKPPHHPFKNLNSESMRGLFLATLSIACIGSAHADNGIHPVLSPGVEEFFPSSSQMRNLFGKSILSFNPGIDLKGMFNRKEGTVGFQSDVFSPEIYTLNLSANGNKLFIFSPAFSYKHQIKMSDVGFLYGKLSVGPTYYDYSLDTDSSTHLATKTIGARFGFEVGAKWGNFELTADYSLFSRTNGLDFNGLKVGAKYRVFRF